LKDYKSGKWTNELAKDLTDLSNTNESLLVKDLYLKYQLSTSSTFDTLNKKLVSDSESLAQKTLWTPIHTKYANTLATAITIENSWHGHKIFLQDIYARKTDKFKFSPAVLAYLAIHAQDYPNTNEKNKVLHTTASNFYKNISSLESHFLQHSIKTVSVVGNSPNILEKAHGDAIDCADCVIRFNNTSTNPSHLKHIGRKFDIWVASPGFDFRSTDSSKPKQICLTGYYPYQRTSKYWEVLQQYSDTEFLDFPSRIWSDLSRQLKAPPSAGLQCLSALSETDCIINAYGFTLNRSNSQKNENNHFADTESRSTRHNWDGESELLKTLQKSRVNFK